MRARCTRRRPPWPKSWMIQRTPDLPTVSTACARRGCRRNEASLKAACGSGCDARRLSAGRSIRACGVLCSGQSARAIRADVISQGGLALAFRLEHEPLATPVERRTSAARSRGGRRRAIRHSCWSEQATTHQRVSPPSQRKGTKTQEFGLEKQMPPPVLSHINGRVAADYPGVSGRPRRRARGAPHCRASYAARSQALPRERNGRQTRAQTAEIEEPGVCAGASALDGSAHFRSASSHWTSSASTAGAVVEPRAVALRAYWRGFGPTSACPICSLNWRNASAGSVATAVQADWAHRLETAAASTTAGSQRQSAPQRNAGPRFCGGLGRAGLPPLKTCSPA